MARPCDLAYALTAVDFAVDLSIEVLERTPPAMQALLGGLSDSYSPFDVVGHLIDGEETDWMPPRALRRNEFGSACGSSWPEGRTALRAL